MWTKRCAIVLLSLTTIAACGDDNGGSEESFCDDFGALQEDLTALADPSTDRLGEIVNDLSDVEPPNQIKSAYDNLVDIYRELISDDVTLTDPAVASTLAEAQSSLAEVEEFVNEECG